MSVFPNRRGFVRAAAAAGLTGARAAAGDRIRIGLIGCGGRGLGLMRMISRYPDVEIPAVSDVIEPRMEQARAALARLPAPQDAEAVLDYRRILDRKDIDAVFIATTQHWHGLPFIHACQAGKHVYVEKPLAHSVAEGRAMVTAARKSGVIALMGTQQRAGAHYRKAVEIVRSGRLGKIGLVECWNYSDRGARAGTYPDSDPPPGYHWDRWLGPAPYVPFNQARLNHGWWLDYSGGVLTNWGPHHFDIVLWAMGNPEPLAAAAAGGKYVLDDLADTFDTFDGAWEFPGFLLSYRIRCFNNFHHLQSRPLHHGICFYGREATLVIDRFGYEIYANRTDRKHGIYEFPLMPPVEKMEGIPYVRRDSGGQLDEPGGQDGPFQRAFLDCVKQGRPSSIDLEESHRGTVWCQLGLIAYQTRRRVRWDGARETIPDDAEAAAMLNRSRRKGYELPVV
jgi:predicted dehydrogenase